MVSALIPWFILFLPLGAAIMIAFITRSRPKLSAFTALFSVLISLMLTIYLWKTQGTAPFEISLDWISIPGLSVQFGFLFNSLSFAMLFIVLGVSILVFYYSMEYMEDDPGFSRYFSFLSFFVFSMLGIVLSNNLLQLFVFWELVGVSSYLLIGFWYEKEAAADAGKKAFLTNRLGDYGFLLGTILLWTASKTLNLAQLEILFSNSTQVILNQSLTTIVCLLIFCGVIGKSAQFPLHVWLPDAMEGPTPVSALIHAATMVAAGVYLLARMFFLFSHSAFALDFISYLGGFTAIFAASLALVQTDIKRVLAYSTLSQLGYMVMAVGLGSSEAAMYHLTTHAFFKALLFLCAGSIIHAAHEQDITKLGNLFRKLPVTGVCFIIGAFALAGIYPLSGFWSKDEILSFAYAQNSFLFLIAIMTAFLTAFYITRAGILVFFGDKNKSENHAHEPQHWMAIPMIILAFFSVTGGWLGIQKWFENPFDQHITWNPGIAGLSSLVSILGIFTGVLFYQLRPDFPNQIRRKSVSLYQLLSHGYFVNNFYNWFLVKVQKPISEFCTAFEHKVIVEKMVNGTAFLTFKIGDRLRKLQTGRVQTYTTVFFSGIVVILYLFLWRGVR